MGCVLKRHDVDKQKEADASDFELCIETRLLKAFEKINKTTAIAIKPQDGKSIAVGASKSKKDIWDF